MPFTHHHTRTLLGALNIIQGLCTNTFGGLLEVFCLENEFIISDYALLPQDTFTYISDAHNTTYCIDHFVSSFSVHQAINVQYGSANRVHNF